MTGRGAQLRGQSKPGLTVASDISEIFRSPPPSSCRRENDAALGPRGGVPSRQASRGLGLSTSLGSQRRRRAAWLCGLARPSVVRGHGAVGRPAAGPHPTIVPGEPRPPPAASFLLSAQPMARRRPTGSARPLPAPPLARPFVSPSGAPTERSGAPRADPGLLFPGAVAACLSHPSRVFAPRHRVCTAWTQTTPSPSLEAREAARASPFKLKSGHRHRPPRPLPPFSDHPLLPLASSRT